MRRHRWARAGAAGAPAPGGQQRRELLWPVHRPGGRDRRGHCRGGDARRPHAAGRHVRQPPRALAQPQRKRRGPRVRDVPRDGQPRDEGRPSERSRAGVRAPRHLALYQGGGRRRLHRRRLCARCGQRRFLPRDRQRGRLLGGGRDAHPAQDVARPPGLVDTQLRRLRAARGRDGRAAPRAHRGARRAGGGGTPCPAAPGRRCARGLSRELPRARRHGGELRRVGA